MTRYNTLLISALATLSAAAPHAGQKQCKKATTSANAHVTSSAPAYHSSESVSAGQSAAWGAWSAIPSGDHSSSAIHPSKSASSSGYPTTGVSSSGHASSSATSTVTTTHKASSSEYATSSGTSKLPVTSTTHNSATTSAYPTKSTTDKTTSSQASVTFSTTSYSASAVESWATWGDLTTTGNTGSSTSLTSTFSMSTTSATTVTSGTSTSSSATATPTTCADVIPQECRTLLTLDLSQSSVGARVCLAALQDLGVPDLGLSVLSSCITLNIALPGGSDNILTCLIEATGCEPGSSTSTTATATGTGSATATGTQTTTATATATGTATATTTTGTTATTLTTSVIPTGTSTPNPDCIETLPGACSNLLSINGLELIPEITVCLAALRPLIDVTNIPGVLACLDATKILLSTSGLQVTSCLENNLVCAAY